MTNILMKRYFRDYVLIIPYLFILIGASLVVEAREDLDLTYIFLGLIVIVISTAFALYWRFSVPTGEDIDASFSMKVEQHKENVNHEMAVKVKTSESYTMITLSSYTKRAILDLPSLRKKDRKDGYSRYSNCVSSIFIFTNTKLIVKEQRFSLVYQSVQAKSSEHYYKDIKSVSSTTLSESNDKKRINGDFSIITSGIEITTVDNVKAIYTIDIDHSRAKEVNELLAMLKTRLPINNQVINKESL